MNREQSFFDTAKNVLTPNLTFVVDPLFLCENSCSA
jgi:hypothetical protein